jgi:hypothetical protein
MKITLEQVERLRKRVECDYQTAERVLRKTGGNEEQAVLYIMKKREHRGKKLLDLLRELVQKSLSFQLALLKNHQSVIRVPVLLVVALVVIFDVSAAFLLVLAVGAVVLGYEFDVYFKHADPIEEEKSVWQEASEVVQPGVPPPLAVDQPASELKTKEHAKMEDPEYEEIIID